MEELKYLKTAKYPFQAQPFPWPSNAFPEFLSPANLNMHYELYLNYITQANQLAKQNPQLRNLTLAEIVNMYPGHIGDVAAQIINHEFFWKCLIPSEGGITSGRIYYLINNQFGSYDNFVKEFSEKAQKHFGSGWVWLVYDPSSNFLRVIDGENAYSPIINGYIPLLTLDVWEHAYYTDYGPNRKAYIDNFWKYINWTYVEAILSEQILGYQVRVNLPGQT